MKIKNFLLAFLTFILSVTGLGFNYNITPAVAQSSSPTLVLTPADGVTLDSGQSVLLILLYDEDGPGDAQPKEANQLAQWSSSDSNLVEINSNGGAIASTVSVGTAQITASFRGLTASIPITVVKPERRQFASEDTFYCTVDVTSTVAPVYRGQTRGYSVYYTRNIPLVGNGYSKLFVEDRQSTGGIIVTKQPQYDPSKPGVTLFYMEIFVPESASYGTHAFSTDVEFQGEQENWQGKCNDFFIIVQAEIMTASTWDLTCSPLVAPDITVGNSSSFQLQTTPATSLNYTYALSPSNGTLPQVSFSPGSNGLTTASFSTTSTTTPANYTITFTGTDSKNVSKQCATTINVSALPTATVTADINCTYNGVTSESICALPASGGSATLNWSSSNASSCSVSVIDAKGTSGSQSVSPSSNQTYTLNCTGLAGTASDSVSVMLDDTVRPGSGPTGNLNCGTADSSENCTVSSSTGSGSTILYWYTNNIPRRSSCNITRNDLATKFTVLPNNSNNGSTGVISGINTYKLICDSKVLDSVVVTVVNSPDPPEPVTAEANINCGQVDLLWTVPSGATGYNVWQSSNQTPRNWTLIKGINSSSINSLTVYPDTESENIFVFAVSAFNNSAESSKAESNMVTINSCGTGSIELSDKDLIKVTRGQTMLTNITEPCNNDSDISKTLEDFDLFQDGDIVDFQINICNSGTGPVSGLSINDQMLNLQRVTTSPIQFSVNSATATPCARLVGDNPMQFIVDSLPAKVSGSSVPAVCSISYKAKVTYQPPVNDPTQKAVAGSLYRFQNSADISNQTYQKTVVTKPFLFQVTGGAPIRTEQAP